MSPKGKKVKNDEGGQEKDKIWKRDRNNQIWLDFYEKGGLKTLCQLLNWKMKE